MSSCCICLTPFSDEFAVLIRCGHCYCNECIREWLARNLNCPTCKKGAVTSDCVMVKTRIKESVKDFVKHHQSNQSANTSQLTASEAALLKALIHESSNQSTTTIDQSIGEIRQVIDLQQSELKQLQSKHSLVTTQLMSVQLDQSMTIQSINQLIVRLATTRDHYKKQRDQILDDRFQGAHRKAINQMKAVFDHLDIQSINHSVNQLIDQILHTCFTTTVLKSNLSINRMAFQQFTDKYLSVLNNPTSINQSPPSTSTVNQAMTITQETKDLIFKLMNGADQSSSHSNSLITACKSSIYDSLIEYLSSRLTGGFAGGNDQKEENELQIIQRQLRELQSQHSQIAHAIQENTKQASMATREAEQLRQQKKSSVNLPVAQRTTSLINQSANQSANSLMHRNTSSINSTISSAKLSTLAAARTNTSLTGMKRTFSHVESSASVSPVRSSSSTGTNADVTKANQLVNRSSSTSSVRSDVQPGNPPRNPFIISANNRKPTIVPLRDKGTEEIPIELN